MIFSFITTKKIIAKAKIAVIEPPGKSQCERTGKFNNRWKVFWKPEDFEDMRKNSQIIKGLIMKNFEGKTFEEILNPILKQARDTWDGEEGLRREREVKRVIERTIEQYQKILSLDKLTILIALEKSKGL